MSSSTVSGGGITLLSSNSATTVTGRIDLDYHRSDNLTSAIINLKLLSSRTVVLTSFPTSIVLPRFGLVSSYRYSFPSIWFPKLIGNSIFFFIILVKHFFKNFFQEVKNPRWNEVNPIMDTLQKTERQESIKVPVF